MTAMIDCPPVSPHVLYSELSLDDMSYGEPDHSGPGLTSVGLSLAASDTTPPCVRLEKCRSPYGIDEPMEEGGSRWLKLRVTSDALLQWFDQLEKKNVSMVADNSESFFRRQLSEDYLREMMYRRPVCDNFGDSTLRLRVESTTRVFLIRGSMSRLGTVSDVQIGCTVLPIVTISKLWFSHQIFGVSVVATDLLVWPSVPIGMRFVFESESEPEETPLPAAVPASDLWALEPEPPESGETAPPAEHVPLGEAAPDETSEATSSSDNCPSDDE